MKKLFYFLVLLIASFRQTFCQVDPMEYPPTGISALQQLQNFPAPRFKPGNGLLPNFNVMDPIYFGGYKQPGVSDASAIKTQADIQRALASDYNYMLTLTWFTGAYNDTCVAIANAHPEWKASLTTLRAQTGGSKMWNQNFANDHYLQNGSGTFLDWSGNPTAYPYKVWRPTAPPGDYSSDGDVVRNALNQSLSKLTRNVDHVTEDGEVYPILESGGVLSDPACVADMNALNITWQQNNSIKWFPYVGRRVADNDKAYSAKFMSHPRLLNAKYTEYRLDGQVSYQLCYQEVRKMQSMINGQYYSTTDLYVRWPYNWKDWVSAWHGLKWVRQARYSELLLGDKLFSPFVAAGYDADPTQDVRPAQWLALMKVMGMYGAEFYYTSYFTESLPANDPAGYAWQAVIPPYAQAVNSHFENILRNGQLLNGDMVDNTYPLGVIPMYQMSTGKTNYVVVGRELNQRYLFTCSIQKNDNVMGSVPDEDVCSFNLNGHPITCKISRKGNTYYADFTIPSAPVFFQVDGWHEYSHPWYWSKEFNEIAPNFDASTGSRKTYAPNAPNYVSYQAVVQLDNQETADYSWTNRLAGTKYLFVKSSGIGQLACTFDQSVQNMNVSGWQKISLGNIALGNHKLQIKSAGSCEFDSISITDNPNKYNTVSCSVSAIISASNPSPCNGDTVLLSASTGVSYQWSDGRIAQTISVFNNATYTVTVSNGNCSSMSAPYMVTFKVCSSCRPPTNIQILNVNIKNFLLSWDRIAEADSGYTAYVDDVTPGFNLHYQFKRAQSKPVNSRPQFKVTGLKSMHNYLVSVSSNCVEMNSEKSTPAVPVTTKSSTPLSKLSIR